MALKLNLESTQFGIPAPQAYAKITNFHGNKDQIQVQVNVYYDQSARENNMAVVLQHAHYIPMSDLTGDIIPAIYGVLKTLPEYEGAIDA
jgi:hypothetical protein